MKHKISSLAIVSALAFTVLTAVAEDKKLDPSKLPPASTRTGLTYEKDMKTIFDNSCVKCHSGEKAKNKLYMDSLAGVLKGGKNGPDVIVGKSGESPLMYAIAHIGDEDDFMPPPNNKRKIPPLTAEQVGLIRAWIDQGAK